MIGTDFVFSNSLIQFDLQRIDEGITEDEAWRLFGQIVDALVHMSTLGILHRDIKLTNIFIGEPQILISTDDYLTFAAK